MSVPKLGEWRTEDKENVHFGQVVLLGLSYWLKLVGDDAFTVHPLPYVHNIWNPEISQSPRRSIPERDV